jgi:vacuolar-type H+-ATPase subunit H
VQSAEFNADVTIAKAELEAARKVFAAEMRAGEAHRKASEADSQESRPS